MISWFSQNFTDSSSSKGEHERFYYGWVVVTTLLVIGVIGFGISLSFGVFLKPLVENFGSTRVLTSGIFSVYMMLGAIFAILGGWALDRYGAKVVLLIMGFFAALSLLLTSQASAQWHLFISYSLLLAMGIGPLYTITMSTVSRWFTERRVLAIGIVGSGMGIGPMLMAPIAAWLIARYDWQTSYFIMGIVAFFIIIPSALLLRKAPVEVAANKLSLPEKPDSNGHGELSLLQAVQTRSFWLLFSIWFFLAFCILLILTHIVPHAIDWGITPVKAASILSLTSGISIIGRVLVSKVSDGIGRKKVAIGCTLLMAGAMLSLTQASNLPMLYFFAVIFGLSYGGIGPPIAAQIGDIFGLRHIGIIMGVLNVGWGAGAAFGSALGGYIFDVGGSYSPAFLTGIAAILITAVLILFLRAPAVKTSDRDGYTTLTQIADSG